MTKENDITTKRDAQGNIVFVRKKSDAAIKQSMDSKPWVQPPTKAKPKANPKKKCCGRR